MPWTAVLVLVLVGCTTGTPAPVSHPPPPPPAQSRQPGVLPQVEASVDLDGVVVGASDAHATLLVVFASWCSHCKVELEVIGTLRAAHPRLRVLGVNYKAHEEYARRGSSDAVRAFVAASAPWLRVVPADDALFTALGRPPKVPTMFVFDRTGALIETYDRRERELPDAAELGALLRRLGA